MDITGEGASVYAEAKGEYTRQLCQYLVPAIHKYFLELFDNAKEQEPEVKKQLVQFQTLLEATSEWNVDKVQRETQRILISTQCDYIEELLTAVFIAHTKVLSAIRLTNKQKKLQITIPKLEHFLHRTLTECARHLWNNTFLFSSSYTPLERQKNMRQVEGLISEGVLQGVRTMLPVKSILREYLAGDESESEYETDSESDEESDEEVVEKPIDPPSAVSYTAPVPVPASLPFHVSTATSVSAPAPAAFMPPSVPTPIVSSQPTDNTMSSISKVNLDNEKPSVKFAEKEQEELLFVDTNDIGFDETHTELNGPTGPSGEEDTAFEFEEIV